MPQTPPRLKVAVISHLYPQRGREGYGVFVAEQTRALVAAGVDVTVVVAPVPAAPWPLPALSPRWRGYAAAEKTRTDFGVVPVALPRYLSFPRKMLREASVGSAVRAMLGDAALRARVQAADVMVAHTALLDGRVAQELSTRLGVPYVVIVHGEDLYQNARPEASAAVRSAVERALMGAAGVITVSNAAAAGLRAAFPQLPEPFVLHNGVDIDAFAPAAPALEADSLAATPERGDAAATRPLRLLSASHLVPRKAQSELLDAVATLVAEGLAIELTIAGPGPERASLEAKVERLCLSAHVRFLGGYRHEDLPALLHETDLFVLPSWDEAFGVVYVEAIACGVPVVAANDGGATDIVDDGVDGFLLPPRDVAAIAAAIRAFSALDDGARGAMAEAARAKAERFTWAANAEAFSAYLKGVVGSE